MRIGLLLTALAAAGIAATATANDTVAERAVGGLVLKQSADIEMVSEDLYVSAEEVRVRYVFRNRAAADIRTLVAFPLPDRDLGEAMYGDSAWPADFETQVDGQRAIMAVERRALLGGADATGRLERLGVPIGGVDNLALAASEAVERLPPAERDALVAEGLVEAVAQMGVEGSQTYYEPRWTVRETWHWEQTFPAGRDLVVEHRYTPATGGTVQTGLTSPEYRATQAGRETIGRYCIDAAFLGGLDRAAARGRRIWAEQWVSYILTTGANWRGPIGDFRLVIDKGAPENLVSFCGDGVRRISPTRFEMRRRNWRPDRNLDVLILTPVDYD